MSVGQIMLNNCGKKRIINHIRFLSSCWACGATAKRVKNLFCSNCNVLQRPDPNINYFKVIGVKETFDLDEEELSRRYKQLQRYLHPDKFATKDKREHEISEEYSSLVNEAYKTLLEPLARGIYMLNLRGQDILDNTEIDKEFLLTIMEKNEEVESAESKEEIMTLNKEIKSKIKELEKNVSKAFFNGDLKKVIRLLSIMKYYTSIDNQIQAAIREKGIIQ